MEKDQNLNGNGNKDQNLGGTAGGDQDTLLTPEQKVTKLEEQLKASQGEGIRLAKELGELKKSKETAEIPEDEKKVRDILSRVEKERTEKERTEEEELDKEMDSLEGIYGPFNREKLLQVVDYFGVYDDEDNVKWDRAMELYNTPGILEKLTGKGEAQVKIPLGKRESSQPMEVEKPIEVSGKSLHQLVQEGLKKLGIKE